MFTQYIFPVLIFAVLGLLAGLLLSLMSVFFGVEADEVFNRVRDTLPGINCGACGYKGCDEYARKIIDGDHTNLCTPGGDKVSAKIGEILDRDFEDVIEKVSFVRCTGHCEVSGAKYEYEGVSTCAGASAMYGGHGDCLDKCLGLGDCIKVCLFGAINIVDGIAVVDRSKCTGCTTCVEACPRGIMGFKEGSRTVYIACSGSRPGKETRGICGNGCIACGRCVKQCEKNAIKMIDNLAKIDYDICADCGDCVSVCPVKCIKNDTCASV